MGPFPKAQGGFEFLFVAIDKFTKWIEVEPIGKITATAAIKFIRGLVVRFGNPNHIIIDNRTQFTSSSFRNYCEEIMTKIFSVSVAHPQSNKHVKMANGMIL